MSLFGGDTYSILRYLVNFLGTLGMLLSLNEYKYPPKRLALCFGLYGVWFFYCTVIMLRYGDYSRIFFVMLSLAIMVPGVILSYLLGRATVPQAVFNYVTQIDLSILLSLPFGLLRDDIGEYWGIDIFYRALLYLIVIYLEREHLQPVFRNLTHAVKSGWWSLALIPVTFLILIAMLGYYPRYYVDYPTMTYYLLAAEATMIMVYVVIVRSLLRQYQMEGVSRDMDLLRLQNSGLTARAEASRIAEEQIRIARHDLRHKLLAVAALLEKDDKEAALRYIGASVENLEKMRPRRFCSNPILDAVFSSYCAQAERDGIRMELSLAIPDQLPVSTEELSTVFANAMENAIHACQKLPREERVIRCKCISSPQLMFKISNPYSGEVRFDESGIPVAEREGHGIGSRSIQAFVRKYGAYHAYQTKDGWFTLTIAR